MGTGIGWMTEAKAEWSSRRGPRPLPVPVPVCCLLSVPVAGAQWMTRRLGPVYRGLAVDRGVTKGCGAGETPAMAFLAGGRSVAA